MALFFYIVIIKTGVYEKMPESEKKIQRKWEIENAVDTLLKAIEIKKDKKLMSDAQKAMKKKQNDISEALRNSAIKVINNEK